MENLYENYMIKGKEVVMEHYGKEVGLWLHNEIEKMIGEIDDPCVDNIRFANQTNLCELKAYDKSVSEGCCGFEDREIAHSESGQIFVIGCNFGH